MLRVLALAIAARAVDLCAPLLKAATVEEALVKLETTEIAEPSECLLRLIEANKWDIATALSTKSAAQDLPFTDELKLRAVAAKKKVEKVLQALDNSGAKVQTVSPALQWAQAPDKVFLDVKFSHRFDSPGCLELADQYVNITETQIKLGAVCTYSSHRMKYNLDIELFAPIETGESSYSFASKGRCSITLKKKEKAAWELPMKGKKPANLQIWWEMRDRYRKAMNRLTGEKDDDELKDKAGLGDLLDNPNVVIKDSFVNGKKFDNSKDREEERLEKEQDEREKKEKEEKLKQAMEEQERKEAAEKAAAEADAIPSEATQAS